MDVRTLTVRWNGAELAMQAIPGDGPCRTRGSRRSDGPPTEQAALRDLALLPLDLVSDAEQEVGVWVLGTTRFLAPRANAYPVVYPDLTRLRPADRERRAADPQRRIAGTRLLRVSFCQRGAKDGQCCEVLGASRRKLGLDQLLQAEHATPEVVRGRQFDRVREQICVPEIGANVTEEVAATVARREELVAATLHVAPLRHEVRALVEARVQGFERAHDPGDVLGVERVEHVEILGRDDRAVERGRDTTDHDEIDIVLDEDSDDRCWIEH